MTPRATASESSKPRASLFEQRGLTASPNDIAHHAGVGVGTVYRHFRDNDQLVEGLFEQLVRGNRAALPILTRGTD